MSRTFRKTGEYQMASLHYDWEWIGHPHYTTVKVAKIPTKKDKAVAKSDGGCWRKGCYAPKSTKWYFKQVSKKYRTTKRELAQKVLRELDYEDFDFFDGSALAKDKGIWWEIH
jgi:hypothetical protein